MVRQFICISISPSNPAELDKILYKKVIYAFAYIIFSKDLTIPLSSQTGS